MNMRQFLTVCYSVIGRMGIVSILAVVVADLYPPILTKLAF
jgi:hypothetical protein